MAVDSKLMMGVGRGNDVYDVHVGAGDQALPVVGGFRDAEVGGHVFGHLRFHVAESDNFYARVPEPAGDVGHVGPAARAQNSDSEFLLSHAHLLEFKSRA